VGDNDFELKIPSLLILNPVFNVDRLWPYFAPFIGTSDIVEQLTPTELNPNYMAQARTDWIMDTNIGHSPAEDPIVLVCQIWPTISPRTKFSRSFPI